MRIAWFAGLDPMFFATFAFHNVNPSSEIERRLLRAGYAALRQRLAMALPPSRRSKTLHRAARALDHLVERFRARTPIPPAVDSLAVQRLRACYCDDVLALAARLGQERPWIGGCRHRA